MNFNNSQKNILIKFCVVRKKRGNSIAWDCCFYETKGGLLRNQATESCGAFIYKCFSNLLKRFRNS